MPDYVANIIPVVSKIAWDSDKGQFRMRVSTQLKQADGTHYSVEIETSADLGALVTLLFQIWTGASSAESRQTAMPQPTAVIMPLPEDVIYSALADRGVVGDVGTADPADDLVDADLI